MQNEIARAGLGLELEGGATIINDLRTIHSLMSGIISLAGSIPKGVSGVFEGPTSSSQRQTKQGFDTHVQQFKAMEKSKTQILETEARERKKIQDREDKDNRQAERDRKRFGPISTFDVDKEVQAIQRKAQLKLQAQEKIDRAEAQAAGRAEARRRREAELDRLDFDKQERNRRGRIAATNNPLNPQRGIGAVDTRQRIENREDLYPYNKAQSAIFKRSRLDPAAMNDPQTIAYRNDYARGLAAFRTVERADRKKAEEESTAHFNRQLAGLREYKANVVRTLASGPRLQSPQLDDTRDFLRASRFDVSRIKDPRVQELRDDTAVQLRASRVQDQERSARDRRYQQYLAQRREEDAADAQRQREFAQRRTAVRNSRENRNISDLFINDGFTDPNGFRNYAVRDRQIQEPIAAQRRRDRAYYDAFNDKEVAFGRSFLPPLPPSPPPPPPPNGPNNRNRGGGGNDPRLREARARDPQGLFNDRGFFTSGEAVGRITRNILLYEVISRATYGLSGYIQQALKAAKTTVEFANALRFSTEQSGGNLAANEKLADSLLQIGLSRQQGRAAVVEATRFAETRPKDTELLTRTVVDIAASRGIGVDKSDELIEQLRRRESKFFKRIFGTTVEEIYTDAASNALDASTTSRVRTPDLYRGVGKEKIKTRSQEISTFLAGMTEAQKETAVFDYVLSQSSKFQGEAEKRADTLAGRLDKMAAAWLNAQEGVGLFITDLNVVNNLLGVTTGLVGKLDQLRPPQLQRTGPNGQPTNADLNKFSIDSTNSFRGRALREVDAVGAPALLGGGASAILSLLGRGPAKESVRLSAYTKAFDEYFTKFNGNVTAAQQEALRASRDLKPGFARSVGEGLKRVTVGMTDSITGFAAIGPISERILPNASLLSARQVRQPFGVDASHFGQATQPTVFGPFSSLEDRRVYNANSRLAQSFRTATGLPTVQGPFSLFNPNLPRDAISQGRTPTITQGQLDRLQSITTGTSVAGGLAGGVIGATVGALVAEKLTVGPITAAGLTITGAIVGNAVGTTIGTAIGTAIVSYIASVGGLGAILTGGITAATAGGVGTGVFAAGTTGGAILGAGVAGAAVLGAGALGVGIGSAINYLNPHDALSEEANRLEKDRVYGKAYSDREKEVAQAEQEGRVRYRDLQSGSPTFNQLFSERQASGMSGFEKGFENMYRRFSREVLPKTSEDLVPKSTRDVEERIADTLGRAGLKDEPSLYRSVTNSLGTVNQVFDAVPLQRDIASKVESARSDYESIQLLEPDNEEKLKKSREALGLLLKAQHDITDEVRQRNQLEEFGTTNETKIAEIEDVRAKQAEARRVQEEKDRIQREKTIGQQATALAKLRETQSGSFKAVYDVANIKTGGSNPYVKVYADMATLAERVQQTFGHLPDAINQYEIELEKIAINTEKIGLRFQTFSNIQSIKGRSADEQATRDVLPGLSRRDSEYLDIQSAIVNKALELPKLWKTAADALGQHVNPLTQLTKSIREVQIASGVGAVAGPDFTGVPFYGTDRVFATKPGEQDQINRGKLLLTPQGGGLIQGFSAGERTSTMKGPDGKLITFSLDQGARDDYAAYDVAQLRRSKLSPDVQSRSDQLYADAVLQITSEYTPEQIRKAGFGRTVAQAAGIKAKSLDEQINDARAKAEYGAISDAQLQKDLTEQDQFRAIQTQQILADPKLNAEQKQLAIRQIGAESDKLLLARTDNIAPKDLTYNQFKSRQEAQAREANREAAKEGEAQKAVAEGQEFQKNLLDAVTTLRDAVISGDLKALIQIQNDTQARIDQEFLEEATGNTGKVPLDQSKVKRGTFGKSLQQRYSNKGVPN